MEFGEYLKEIRIDKNLSIRKLAELSDVSAMYISELERGKRENPSPEVLKKLSEGLGERYEKLMLRAGYLKFDNPNDSLNVIKALEGFGVNFRKEIENQTSEPINVFTILTLFKDVYWKDQLLSHNEKQRIIKLIEALLEE